MIYFIYETLNRINGKRYRGIHKTSNLDDGYIGSGIAFKKAVEKYGKENFSREIIEFCDSYEELLEKEKIYVDSEWIEDYSNYNLKTGGQSNGILSDESKKRISETLKRKYENGEISKEKCKFPEIPWNKDKRDVYDESTLEMMSNSASIRYDNDPEHPLKKFGNKIAWNRGLKIGPHTEESNKKRSETLKERYKNQEHPTKGKDPWNKGRSGTQEAWNKGKEMEKIECPHCNKLVDKLNAKRWHFDNCKCRR